MEDRLLIGSGAASPGMRAQGMFLAALFGAAEGASPALSQLPWHLNRLLGERTIAGRAMRFVPSEARSALEYEARIHDRAEIEVRDNLHDLYNALAWFSFPQTKSAINRVHIRELGARGAAHPRGTIRDAVTLIDESGLVVATDSSDVLRALARASWSDLFVARRAQFEAHCRCFVIGHGLAVKLHRPYKALTGHALVVRTTTGVLRAPEADLRAAVDTAAALRLARPDLSARELVPIPVLGLPGWWPANQDPEFYADRTVFRPRRQRRDDGQGRLDLAEQNTI